jgi:predicted transcriptional regulator
MAPESANPVAVKPPPDLQGRISQLAETRDSFVLACLHAWHHYQDTGRHLSFEDADAWLAELEAGRDVEPPECRG